MTSRATGLPPGLRFRTKGQLAIDICAEAYADGVTFDFICGDEVYGASTELPAPKSRGQAYVLRVAFNFTVTLAGRYQADLRAGGEDAAAGQAVMGGPLRRAGFQGPAVARLARIATASPRHCLLIRRHLKTGELAFCYCHVPKDSRLRRRG